MSALPRSFIPDESEKIYQDLSDSLDQFAAQAALFESNGPGGCFYEMDRKVLLAELTEEIRGEYVELGEKITDGRADNLAHMHPAYKEFIRDGKAMRTEYHRLKAIRIDHYTKLRSNDRKGIA